MSWLPNHFLYHFDITWGIYNKLNLYKYSKITLRFETINSTNAFPDIQFISKPWYRHHLIDISKNMIASKNKCHFGLYLMGHPVFVTAICILFSILNISFWFYAFILMSFTKIKYLLMLQNYSCYNKFPNIQNIINMHVITAFWLILKVFLCKRM